MLPALDTEMPEWDRHALARSADQRRHRCWKQEFYRHLVSKVGDPQSIEKENGLWRAYTKFSTMHTTAKA